MQVDHLRFCYHVHAIQDKAKPKCREIFPIDPERGQTMIRLTYASTTKRDWSPEDLLSLLK